MPTYDPTTHPHAESEFHAALLSYKPLIRKLARTHASAADDREDFQQDLLMYVLERRDLYRPDAGSLGSFLYYSALGVKNMKQPAKRQRAKEVSAEVLVDGQWLDAFDVAAVECNPDCAIDLAIVTSLLADINGGDDLLRLAEGASLSEIAADRGVSKQAVEQRSALARSRLLKVLGEPDAEGAARDVRIAASRAAYYQRRRQRERDASDDHRQPVPRIAPILMRSTSTLTRMHDLLAKLPSRSPHSAPLARV